MIDHTNTKATAEEMSLDDYPAANMAHIATVRDMAMAANELFISLGVTLANAGLIRRSDLAEQLGIALDQQRQRDGASRPAASRMIEAAKLFFEAPVWNGERPN